MAEAEGLSGVFARLQRGPLAVLFLVFAVAWMPGFFTLPPLDRDEARFAQATKQMLETGDVVAMRLGDEARNQKPIGIYWLQGLATTALNGFVPRESAYREIWTYRVPSFLGAFAAVALTFWMTRLFAGLEAGFLAALLLGFTLLLATEAKIAKTDAVLLATIVGAQSLILRAFVSAHPEGGGVSRPGFLHGVFAWACFGFGILVKGPVILLVCLATIILVCIWDRRVRWLSRLRVFTGILVAAAIVLPWAIAIYVATDGAFYTDSLGGDFALKLVSSQETHGGWPGYYLLLMPVTFWPGTLILFPALLYAARHRREPGVRVLLCWFLVAWLMFEIAPTKLPHYILPAYPPLAILGALFLTRAAPFPKTRMERFTLRLSLGLFLLVGFLLSALVIWAPYQFGGGVNPWVTYAVALTCVAIFAAVVVVVRGWLIEGAAVSFLAAFLLYCALGYGTVTELDQLRLSPQIAEAVARETREGDPPALLAGYSEPSALFLMGTETVFANGTEAGALAARQGGVTVVEEGEQPEFLAAVNAAGARATQLRIIEGINYSNARDLTLFLYRVTPSAR
jgi:4-amino-4-deoxy-L-arabinose transferase-like glycosyltransferase